MCPISPSSVPDLRVFLGVGRLRLPSSGSPGWTRRVRRLGLTVPVAPLARLAS